MILWESGFQFPFDRGLILGTSFRKALQNLLFQPLLPGFWKQEKEVLTTP